ncbi:helix-turn-helix domain-containing protein [Candidatus Poribacteria bacterium]|nr:helix-turn-helix domain-containing protein [Candidatus Poribacteria bacterium]
MKDLNWNNEDEILSTEQVMKLLSVSRPALYRWIETQGLPVKRIGRNYRYRKSEVLEWFESKDVTRPLENSEVN